MSWKVDVVANTSPMLGECPLWIREESALLWVDIPAGDIWKTVPATGKSTRLACVPPASAIVQQSEDIYVVVSGCKLIYMQRDGKLGEVVNVLEESSLRFNDAAAGPDGTLWVGTASSGKEAGTAALYCLGRDHSAEEILRGITMSNGLGWSPENSIFYYVDTPTGRVDRFDYRGEYPYLFNRATCINVPQTVGLPDGLAVDLEGCIWLAVWGGGVVNRYTPAGRLVGSIELPVRNVTSCAFGGDSMTTLFITSAKDEGKEASSELAGAIFASETYVPGVEHHRYLARAPVTRARNPQA